MQSNSRFICITSTTLLFRRFVNEISSNLKNYFWERLKQQLDLVCPSKVTFVKVAFRRAKSQYKINASVESLCFRMPSYTSLQ